MNPALDAEALGVLENTPGLIRALIGGLDDGLEGDGSGWGPHSVIAHLIDTEDGVFRTRIGRIVEGAAPRIRPIDPERRLAEGGYAGRSTAELLDTFETMRAESLRWLRRLDPQTLARTGEHEVAGTISAGQLVNYWATHDLVHLRQVVKGLQDRFLPRIGNMHAFLED